MIFIVNSLEIKKCFKTLVLCLSLEYIMYEDDVCVLSLQDEIKASVPLTNVQQLDDMRVNKRNQVDAATCWPKGELYYILKLHR